jgi:ferredoxin
MAKIKIDKNKCIGCGACVALCPAIFELKNGKAEASKKEVKGDEEKCARDAAGNCPVQAISVK